MSDADTSSPLLMTEFDYQLPTDLIAQFPLERRSESRLLVLDRSKPELEFTRFDQLPQFLNPGDVLVFNDSRVLPARLLGARATGGAVEFLLLRRIAGNRWRALAKPAAKLRPGELIIIHSKSGENSATATLAMKHSDGQVEIELDRELAARLSDYGRMPLPPYITQRLDDDDRYQTVYSRAEGSAAAPTAGLHFTDDIIETIRSQGIGIGFVTLHVGLDTFRPVTEDDARNHAIHREWCNVDSEVIDQMRSAKERGNRVIAVGTTTARTLETWAAATPDWNSEPYSGESSIYITPGYHWRIVDAMLTNFHLPRSTLLLMVSALASRDRILDAYQQAIEERFRFFSFGDAMLIV